MRFLVFSENLTGRVSSGSRSCKMAVRWGAGDETLTTCNIDFFRLETLDETTGLRTEGTLDTFQGCLDPSILSMFEDTPAIETREHEDETEATLLTALTEILDNVDEETLSPFDTLPESDLLSGHKGREHSPLRRLFCLSRSPQEKDVIFGKFRSTGKTLPMVQQRSDGEEEEDSLTLSPGRLELSSENGLFEWEGLPITFEQDGEERLSVSLGDFVKHVHPYCMEISLEDNKGEHMLPEGGILLEVVDQGENGEAILTIPEMNHPISIKLDEPKPNSKSSETDDSASDTSEHIVVDDDYEPPMKDEENKVSSNVKGIMSNGNPKDDASQRKSTFSRLAASPQPIEGRVLRSSSKKRTGHKQTNKRCKKKLLKDKMPKELDATNSTLFTKFEDVTTSRSEGTDSKTTTAVSLLPVSSKQTVLDQSETQPKAECIVHSKSVLTFAASAPEKEEGTPAEPTAPKGTPSLAIDQAASPGETQTTESTGEPSPPLPAVTVEAKPKALSLAEYRRLRQQKKPTPIKKQDDNSTKWPSLPEMPRELPPIPHLPEPSPRDPRRSRPQSNEVEEVKPAWMPRGPCAPPTPEALLAPPAYMVNKVSTTTVPKPQKMVSESVPPQLSYHDNTSAASICTEESNKGADICAVDSPKTCQTSEKTTTDEIKPAANVLTSIYYNAGSLHEPKASMNSTNELPKSIDCGQGVSFPVNVEKTSNQRTCDKSEKSQAGPLLQPKSPTKELIEAFTSEMGIEATDLTSLLEQFEETQAKEEQCMPEVSGRAVAVGNSRSDLNYEKNDVQRVRANDLSSTALTPPATPPHPMWKPLVPLTLLSKMAETKSSQSKVIEIEAQPQPSTKARSKLTPATTSVAPDMACHDHDYCLPNKGTSTGEAGKRWNVKQNTSITIIPVKQPSTSALQNLQAAAAQSPTYALKTQQFDRKTENLKNNSVLETPDASPIRDGDANNSTCTKQRSFGRRYRQRAKSCTPSPKRSMNRSRVGRSRYRSPSYNSSESDSSRSRSRSFTPPKKRYRQRRSRSSSSSQSRSSSRSRSPSLSPHRRRYSYSSSRSVSSSCSRSRSRSRSRTPQWSRKRLLCSPSYRDFYGTNVKMNQEVKRRKEKAIEERRVVYVGRIRGTMTQKELKERFSYFGEIEECTLHFRDHGDNYGFVTYYNTNDAFMAIENGSKLRKPDELPFDLCFGGRRQFCKSSYADLDSSREYDPLPSRNKIHALDFDTLLKQAQQNLKR